MDDYLFAVLKEKESKPSAQGTQESIRQVACLTVVFLLLGEGQISGLVITIEKAASLDRAILLSFCALSSAQVCRPCSMASTFKVSFGEIPDTLR